LVPPLPRTLHHVGIAVPSLEGARALYELLEGVQGSPVEELPDQGVRVQFFGAVELLEPLGADTPVGRFLARRGPGIHHVAWQVSDLAGTLRALEADGMELIDREPRIGAGGHQVAFLHPRSTGGTLVELVEAAPHSPPTPTGSG
jgi:methylmalonyl-CoA epimerase